MYYYRNKDAKEIDVVLEHDGILNPIEIKKTSKPGTELIKVFGLLDKASTPHLKGAVMNGVDMPKLSDYLSARQKNGISLGADKIAKGKQIVYKNTVMRAVKQLDSIIAKIKRK